MKKLLTSLFLATLILSAQNNATKDANATTAKSNEQKALTFNLTATNGTKIDIVETKEGLKYTTLPSKEVILFFYIYDGAPCQKELEVFKKLKAQNKDKLEIVAIELKGLDKEKLSAYAKKKELNFLSVVGKDAMNFVQYIAQRAQWQGTVPFIIITDKEGRVKHIQIGFMNQEQLQKVLSN